MILGATLFKMNGDPYTGIVFPRQTLKAVFAVEVSNVVGAAVLTVTVETRNRADTGWTPVGTFPPIAGSGYFPFTVAGLMELVRLTYVVAGPGPTSGMHVFTNAPQWLMD